MSAVTVDSVIAEARAHQAKMQQLQADNDFAMARLLRYALLHIECGRMADATRVLNSAIATLENPT